MLTRKYRQQVKQCLTEYYDNPKDTPQQRLQLLIHLLTSQIKCFFVVDLKLPSAAFQAWQNNQWALLAASSKKLQRKNHLLDLSSLKETINHNLTKLKDTAVTQQDATQLLLSLQKLRAETLQRNAIGESLLVTRLRIIDEAYKRIVTNTSSTTDNKYTRNYIATISQTSYTIKTESSMQLLINHWQPTMQSNNNKIILLLAGRNLGSNSYQGISTALSQEGYHVIAPHLTGMTNKKASIESIANDLKSIYKHIKINHPNTEIIPMGHSLGATILLCCHSIFCPQELKKMILINPALNEFGVNKNNNALSLVRWLLAAHKRCLYKNALPETKIIRERSPSSYPRFSDKIHHAYYINKLLTNGYKNLCRLADHTNNINIFIVQSTHDKVVNNIRMVANNTQYKMIYGDHLQVIRDGEYFAKLAQDFIEAA